jgi:hypothetical protein
MRKVGVGLPFQAEAAVELRCVAVVALAEHAPLGGRAAGSAELIASVLDIDGGKLRQRLGASAAPGWEAG